jgi:hypothetical protein
MRPALQQITSGLVLDLELGERVACDAQLGCGRLGSGDVEGRWADWLDPSVSAKCVQKPIRAGSRAIEQVG